MRIAHDTLDGVRYAAVIEDKKMVALYARPDDDRLWTGDVVTAKVMRYAPSQRAYFLNHEGQEAFLPHKDALAFQPGQTITVRVERPATQVKHIRCSFAQDAEEGRGADCIEQARVDYPGITDIAEGLQDYDAAILALQDVIVKVQNGLEIVIEETAAFVAVDINLADPHLKPFEANRLACRELLRQMRLRNLSGQILIDCLRLHSAEQRRKFHDDLQDAIAADPREVALYGFTRLGLFEMTRARVGLSLNEIRRVL